MEIKNRNEKRVYDLIMEDINNNGLNYSLLTNVKIGMMLNISPITARDKVLKLVRQNQILSLINYFDENNKYFQRKMLKGNISG